MNIKFAWPLLAAAAACSSNTLPSGQDAGPPDGGPPPGTEAYYSLDPSTMDATKPIAMALGPNDRVGVTYFMSVNSTDYALKYVEWQNGVVSSPETVVVAVQRVYGLSMAFNPATGQPAVAYLGGGSDGSVFWNQSDAAISYRSSAGLWTEQIAARLSVEPGAECGNPVSDNPAGKVVGLYPALTFFGGAAYLAYRDIHEGQYPVQDYNGSDLKLAWGGPTSWNHLAIICGGNDKLAWGGHNQMIRGAQGRLALFSDQMPGLGPDVPGINGQFNRRNTDGSWMLPTQIIDGVNNTQAGASAAYDSTTGYAYSVLDRTSNTLLFTSSSDGNVWSAKIPIVQEGTTGWYPSIAVDPGSHEPEIAYYHCSNRAGVAEGSCPPTENQLRLMYRVGGSIWRGPTLLDSRGGVFPKLDHLSNGRRVVAYRDPFTGAIKLYIGP